nr:integrase, catalytic region, zinc finger, CCHC-type, peptidase aspartic, catalytic [Tanacetum cinerariifolium]
MICDLTHINHKVYSPPSSISQMKYAPTVTQQQQPEFSQLDSGLTVQVVQIVLWYLNSGCSKQMTRDRSQLINFVNKLLGTVKFQNDHLEKIMRYGDYEIGNVTISNVYYVEGLGHNVGISHETSVACSSQQNGAVKRHNHTLIEAARTIVDHPAPEVIAPIADVVAPEAAASTGSPFLTTVDQDAPSPNNSQTSPETQTRAIYNDVEEDNHDLDVAHMNNNPFFGVVESPKTPTFRDDPLYESLHEDPTSQGSSSNMRQTHTPFKSVGRWTKDHPIANVIKKSKLDEDLKRKPVDATLYRGMTGSLVYMTSSRPNITYAVCLCAGYQAQPTEKHLNAVK